MKQRLSIIVAAVLAITVLAASAWYYLSPQMTLKAMRDAAQAHNSKEFASYVDFPALRDSFKSQLRAKVSASVLKARDQGGGFAALGPAFAMGMIDPMVDSVITPEMLQAAFDKEAREKTPPALKTAADAGADGSKIVRTDFDHFEVRRDDTPGVLRFERSGISWRLVAIDLPPGEIE